MIALPVDLETELQTHEDRRDDAAGARRTLEEAVTLQLRTVADGLLAEVLLGGGTVPGAVWWQQFLSREEDPPQYAPDLKHPAFRTYRQRVAQQIATGQIQRTRLGDFEEIPIRIYGGYCRFVEEGRINRQLAGLGSSLRLLVVGSQRSRADRTRRLLGKSVDKKAMPDGRFIFGRIGPISVFNGAALFLFEREWAVSPFMEVVASGFTDEARIVVRQVPLRAYVEETQRGLRDRREDGEEDAITDLKRVAFEKQGRLADAAEVLCLETRSVLVHESAHIALHGSGISKGRSGIDSWHDAVREDLVRYAHQPRTLDEFKADFLDFFGKDSLTLMMGPRFEVPRPEHSFSLEEELKALQSDGLLLVDGDGRFYSTCYGSRRRWMV